MTDLADVLPPDAEQALSAKLIFEREDGSQSRHHGAVNDAEPISDFTTASGDAWKISRRDVGDGRLIESRQKDRKVSIMSTRCWKARCT